METAFHPSSFYPAFEVINGTIHAMIYGIASAGITADEFAPEALSAVEIFEVEGGDAVAMRGVNTGRVMLVQAGNISTERSTRANKTLDHVISAGVIPMKASKFKEARKPFIIKPA